MSPPLPCAPAQPRRKLPIGIQTFAKLREQGCYYVDKTGLLIDLIESGPCFFLSRPRRFGKSLLVDTMKELFEGNRALFAGLAAESRWDWSQRHPVIQISFSDGVLRDRTELDRRIHDILRINREQLGLTPSAGLDPADSSGNLLDLIRQAHRNAGEQVVVLIDEYDKPILDNIESPERAREMREGLKNLYSVLKGADAHLKFVFLTGVSKFSKVSLFSGLNQLIDITLDPEYSALCGYTDADLDTVFAPELPGLDREQIRRWYNGYNWLGESVYNPFDVLLLFRKRRFQPYWFETGTPSFLTRLLAEQHWFTPELSRVQTDEAMLTSFEVEHIEPLALLFQAGYLTLHGVQLLPTGDQMLTLGYPNREVEVSLNRVLLPSYGVPERVALHARLALIDALMRADLGATRMLLHALYAGIPNDWYRNSFEGHYASVFYSHLAGLGFELQVEDATNLGRIDLTLRVPGQLYLFEFKVVEQQPVGQALAQIRTRGYADKYRSLRLPIHLIGVEFSKADRNIVGFEVETLLS